MFRTAVAALALALLPAAPALAGSLPTVPSGERPGPPALYAPPVDAPELSVQAPFAAPPLLVSGSEAYRDGEYLYQDYLFDDRGADTQPSGTRGGAGDDIASSTGGDVRYPTAPRYAGNAADLAELRLKPTPDAVVYRATLTTALAPDAAVVGIGINKNPGAADLPVPWPRGAGVSTPGLDAFVTAWGTGGELTTFGAGGSPSSTPLPAGAVSMDTTTNQMTIRVPRTLLDPGATAVWRHVAGVGLWSGTGWKTPRAGTAPTADEPASGSDSAPAPGVFNLAFRFDEPQTKVPTAPYTTFPGIGNWFEDKQSRALADGKVADPADEPGKSFYVDVDFAKLAARADQGGRAHPGREQARIMASGLDTPEGVPGSSSFPGYGGRLQPYLLTVPPGYDASRPAPLTFSLHSLGGTYTQYAVFSPNQLRQFGDERGSLVATPLGRGTNGWYTDEAETDFFEVWADVARHFELDPEKVALTGYSMGGYGTYKLGTQYPDLFGKAFTTVGPPGRGIWVPPAPPSDGADTNSNPVLENVRWIPYLNWVQASDELVPYAGPRAQQMRFDALGLRSQLWTFSPGEHFTLAVVDGWARARDFLGDARVTRDPFRVDYAFIPAADRPKLGLVHDHAYWVSRLRARDLSGEPKSNPARAEIDARSLAYGQGDPVTHSVAGTAGADGDVPKPDTVEGTDWDGLTAVAPENALVAKLRNVASGEIAGTRARLDGSRRLRVDLDSDGPATVRLQLPIADGMQVERIDGESGPAPEVKVDPAGATIALPGAGRRVYRLSPPNASCRDRTAPESRIRTTSRLAGRTHKRLTIKGVATDKGCPGKPARISRVSVSIARAAGGGKCRLMTAGGRFGIKRSCSRTIFNRARGTTRWAFRLPRRHLPAGRYLVWSRAVDASRNGEPKVSARNRLRFRVLRRR